MNTHTLSKGSFIFFIFIGECLLEEHVVGLKFDKDVCTIWQNMQPRTFWRNKMQKRYKNVGVANFYNVDTGGQVKTWY